MKKIKMNPQTTLCPTPVSLRENYILPFNMKTEKNIVIIQGYNGRWSHKKNKAVFPLEPEKEHYHDDRFSLDFKLPLGAEVLASKAGVVGGFNDGIDAYYDGLNSKEGIKTYSNLILLRHQDKSFTIYSHLQKNSIKVKVGERVAQGQVIALTGKSGWIGPIPHLHFETIIYEKTLRKSFPIRFNNYPEWLENKN